MKECLPSGQADGVRSTQAVGTSAVYTVTASQKTVLPLPLRKNGFTVTRYVTAQALKV